MNNGKIILISPLDWGIGHATRLIPIIGTLLKKGNRIILGADEKPLALLRKEFPQLPYYCIPSYGVKYATSPDWFVWKLGVQLPKILWAIWREHQVLKTIIKKERVDVVISDNRFGMYHASVKTIFITHQITILVPSRLKFIENIVLRTNHWFIKKFNELWIPDYENNLLSGELSRNVPDGLRVNYLGNISRFNELTPVTQSAFDVDVLVVLSGPEPQRSIFENLVVQQLKNSQYKSLIVRGRPTNSNDGNIKQIINKVYMVEFLTSERLLSAYTQASYIICRSGYSSILDLVAIGRTAILVPTPGQTEQEYLALHLMQKKWFYMQYQKNFRINDACLEVHKYKFPSKLSNSSSLHFLKTVSV